MPPTTQTTHGPSTDESATPDDDGAADKPPIIPPIRTSASRRSSRASDKGERTSGVFRRMFSGSSSKQAPAAVANRSRSSSILANGIDDSPPDSPDVYDTDDSHEPWSRPPSAGPPGTRSRASSTGARERDIINSPATPRPPSVAGSIGEGQRFNLKDLLASGPKLTRKSSASSRKSASSHKSDSDRGGTALSDSGASLLKKYGVCERVAIGKGATSVVRLAHKWDRTEEKLYAVKEFRKRRKTETEKEYVKKLTAEFCISSTLHHPNVVETVDLVQDDNQHWCEVMEYCPGGDLYAAIKKGGMSGSEVECCFRQMLDGVGYLHGQGVAHRDIKPENIFFDARGQLKIGDYGASTVYRLPWETTVHMSTGLCGSEPYIAPEQFASKPYDARLVDIWACGVVYYCLHFQELPWRVAKQTDNLFQTYSTACASSTFSLTSQAAALAAAGHLTDKQSVEREKNMQYPETINNLSPRACRPILRRMLEPDPKQRATIEQALKNTWVAAIDVCTLPNKTPKHIHQCARISAGLPPTET